MIQQRDRPDVPVATIRILAQDACSPARQRSFNEVPMVRPAHAPAAPRPLGSRMRARLLVYPRSTDLPSQGEWRVGDGLPQDLLLR